MDLNRTCHHLIGRCAERLPSIEPRHLHHLSACIATCIAVVEERRLGDHAAGACLACIQACDAAAGALAPMAVPDDLLAACRRCSAACLSHVGGATL